MAYSAPGAAGAATSGSIGTVVPVTPDLSQAGFLNIESDFLQAYDVTNFAVAHAQAADSYIAQLGQLALALVPPTITPQFPINPNTPTITVPPAPTLYPFSFALPQPPLPFNGTLSVDTQLPDFVGVPPQLIFPNAPLPPDLSAPISPSINTNFGPYPTIDVELPTAPSLLSINVQPFGGVTLPTFDATSPVLNLAAPSITPYLQAAPYTDALLSGVIGTLQDRISTGYTGINTGLPATVEENIWNRGREREYRQQAAAIRALDKLEGMGYALPPGAHLDARIRIETEMAATMVGLSRDVMIKQAELEQENMKMSLQLAVDIESKLISYASERDQRMLEAAKYATDAAVSIYNAGVQAYSARVSAYRAAVEVYTAQIAGARAIIDVYTAELDAAKLMVSINEQNVQLYKTQIEAATSAIEVYKAQIEIIQTEAQIEQLKVSIFGEQVKAYAAEINVFTAQIEAYKTQIEAEGTKENIYGTQANVYGTLVGAQVKIIESNIEVFKAQLAEKTEEYDAYKAQVDALSEQTRAIASANSSVAQLYSATISGTSSYNDAMVKEWEAYNTTVTQIASTQVAAAQAQGNLYLTAKSVATDAAKVGAQVEAQLAASALGTVTWATHRSRQDSFSKSQSASSGMELQNSMANNTSTSDTHQYDELTHYNQNMSTSVQGGTVTYYNHNIQSSE